MRVEKVKCDIRNCKNENAVPFSTFKERKADAAGSMENWYICFDLCPVHTKEVLQWLLTYLVPDKLVTIEALVKRFGVEARVE